MRILERGIYFVVFCLPLYLIRFNIFNIPTTLLELLIYVLFILWLVKGFKFKEFKALLLAHCSLFSAIFLILIGAGIAVFYSWNIRTSLGILKGWFVDPLLFFVVVVSVIKKPKQFKGIFYSLILSGFIISIISLIYLVCGKLDASSRLQIFYTSPNYLAMYLMPIFILSFYLFLEEKRAIFLFAALLIFLVIVFTESFGAFLGLIFALIFGLGVYLYKKKPTHDWLALAGKKLFLIILCFSIVIVLLLIYWKINSIQGKLSLNSRLEIWQRAWNVFKAYPFIGIGPGTFGDYFPPYPRWGVPQPHNLYLAFLIQTGIFGFIGFIWLVVWFFKRGFEDLKKNLLSLPLLIVMVYFLGHGLVDTTYWKNDLSIFFWLIIGLMAILKKNPG